MEHPIFLPVFNIGSLEKLNYFYFLLLAVVVLEEREKYRSKLTFFASQYQSKSSTCLEFFCILSIKIETEAVVARDTTEVVVARDTTEVVVARDTTEVVVARDTTEAAAVVTPDNLASGQAAKGRGEDLGSWRIRKVASPPGS